MLWAPVSFSHTSANVTAERERAVPVVSFFSLSAEPLQLLPCENAECGGEKAEPRVCRAL